MRFEFIADEHVKVKTFLKRHEISKGLLAKIKFSGGTFLSTISLRTLFISWILAIKVTIDIPSEKGFESLKAVDKDLSVIYEMSISWFWISRQGWLVFPSVNHSNTMANFVKAYYIRQGYETSRCIS